MNIDQRIHEICKSIPHPIVMKYVASLIEINEKYNIIKIKNDEEYLDLATSYGMQLEYGNDYDNEKELVYKNYPNIPYPYSHNLAHFQFSNLHETHNENKLLIYFEKCFFIYNPPDFSYDFKEGKRYTKKIVKPYIKVVKQRILNDAQKDNQQFKILSHFDNLISFQEPETIEPKEYPHTVISALLYMLIKSKGVTVRNIKEPRTIFVDAYSLIYNTQYQKCADTLNKLSGISHTLEDEVFLLFENIKMPSPPPRHLRDNIKKKFNNYQANKNISDIIECAAFANKSLKDSKLKEEIATLKEEKTKYFKG